MHNTDDSEFTEVTPFHIDNEELATTTAEQAFVLGVEWQMVRNRVGEEVIVKTVHTSNQRRVDKMLSAEGYFRRWWINDDWSDFIAARDERVIQEEDGDGRQPDV